MTKQPNTIEKDLNKIRIQLYEMDKNLSPAERVKRAKERTMEYEKRYGIKAVSKPIAS